MQTSIYMDCGFSYTGNAGSAQSRGIEFESTADLGDDLMLTLNASYTQTELMEDVESLDAVISGLESQNGRPSDPRASIVVPADGQPWRCPAGKPWHEFVSCCSRAGRRLPTYVRRALARDSGWLRCLVGSDGLCILKISSGGERRRRSSCETQNRCAWALLTSDRVPWVCWRRPSSRSSQSRRETFGPPPVTAASRRFRGHFVMHCR